MAAALGVRLAKTGVYSVGVDDVSPTAPVIGEAAVIVWQGGAVTLLAAAGLAALVATLWR